MGISLSSWQTVSIQLLTSRTTRWLSVETGVSVMTSSAVCGDVNKWRHSIFHRSGFVLVECQQGSYYTDNDCVLCDFGTFQNETGQTFCFSCAEGNSTSFVGARNESDCDGMQKNVESTTQFQKSSLLILQCFCSNQQPKTTIPQHTRIPVTQTT